MFRKCLLALSVVGMLAIGSASARADRCYRDYGYGYRGPHYRSHSLYYRGGYPPPRYSRYAPPYAYRDGYVYSHGRRYTHAPSSAPRGGFYLSIGL